MNQIRELFMQAVSAALKNEYVSWDGEIPREDWEALLELSRDHRMLPMVYQAVSRCPAFRRTGAQLGAYRLQVMQMVALQVRKTGEFSALLNAFRDAGLEPLVVKGITCRSLYPNPDFRLSSDEDILIPPEDFPRFHRVLTGLGYVTPDPRSDAYELSYQHPGGTLYLELHRSLFPPENPAYGDLNRLFPDLFSRSVCLNGIPTLNPTDHMLYLLCHAFKHFLHSGFGLRQVCDLVLFANRYGPEIDWAHLLECCRRIRADRFAAGLFRIGWKYLGFSPEQARYPLAWQAVYVDEGPLLEDILLAGIYGSADPDRVHSSSITLHSVAPQTPGAEGLLQTVFPPRERMQKQYPYLKDRPLLLPVAWTDRILRYGRSGSTPRSALRIGAERVELFRRYGILDKE